jgi:hypothetical protein
MPIDDHPIAALKKQFDMEDLSISPVTRTALSILSRMRLPPLLDKSIENLKGHLAADSSERIRLLLETVAEEVRKHENAIQHL